jgi:hypothetical protein
LGLGTGVQSVGFFAIRGEDERIADLWREERALPVTRGRSSFRLSPVVGLGGIGIRGAF